MPCDPATHDKETFGGSHWLSLKPIETKSKIVRRALSGFKNLRGGSFGDETVRLPELSDKELAPCSTHGHPTKEANHD